MPQQTTVKDTLKMTGSNINATAETELNSTSVTGSETDNGLEQSTTEFTPIVSQTQLDKLIGERLQRERRKYADYEELKAKTERYEQEEEKHKTQLEKLETRAIEAETRLTELEQLKQLTDWKNEISEQTGVPVKALRGTTKEEITEHANQIAQMLEHARKTPQNAFLPRETATANEHVALNSSELENALKRAVGIY